MCVTSTRFAGAALICVVVACSLCQADETAERGRSVLEEHKNVVVTVKLVTKISWGGQTEEMPNEVTGTAIDPTGLTVVSLTETDPTTMFGDMMEGQGARPTAEVKDIKFLLEDGREIESEIVLRDKDLDLAFLRPVEKPAEPMACVDLAQGAAPQLLDELISLNRLGKVAGREYGVSVERVQSIIKKPRTFYVMGKEPTLTSLGAPVFTVDGKFVGIVALRSIQAAAGGGMMSMLGEDSIMPVVVTAEDIAESAKQVPPFGVKPAPEQVTPPAEVSGQQPAPAEKPAEEAPSQAPPAEGVQEPAEAIIELD